MIMIALWVWLVGIPLWVVFCGVFSDDELAQYCPIWPLAAVVLVVKGIYNLLFAFGRSL
jgi:hypothetical protein